MSYNNRRRNLPPPPENGFRNSARPEDTPVVSGGDDMPPPYSVDDPYDTPPALPARRLSVETEAEEDTPPLPSRPGSSASSIRHQPALPARRSSSRLSLSTGARTPPPIPSRSHNGSSLSVSSLASPTSPSGPAIPSRNYQPQSPAPGIPARTYSTGVLASSLATPTVNIVDTATNQFRKMSLGSQGTGHEMSAVDFDTPIANSPPPQGLLQYRNHPIPLPPNYCKTDEIPTVHTNKFYGNMFLGQQRCPIWTHPYSLWLTKELPFVGIAATHIRKEQRVFDEKNNPPQFFFSPTNIKSLVFSAMEFSEQTAEQVSLNFSGVKHMSLQLQLRLNDSQFVWFPVVQGMGFITAIYYNLTPVFQSAVGFRSVELIWTRDAKSKYRVMLENGITWTLYAISSEPISLGLVNGNTLSGNMVVNGCIFQVVADTCDEIDSAVNCYPIDVELSAAIDRANPSYGEYSFNYTTNGNSDSGRTLMYALPHHAENMLPNIQNLRINSRLDSTVYGEMQGFITNSFEMQVTLPHEVEFEPYSTVPNKVKQYSADVIDSIARAASSEVNGDVINESNLDSMYFSGKVVAKYAWILYCCHFVVRDDNLTMQLLGKLKEAMQRFFNNQQILPLVYDTTWGGIISSGTESQDFGNPNYNDHHFHYSYHVVAASIIAKVDRDISGNDNWLNTNREWVELLIRDYANPSKHDKYFPVFRSFDWFNGHSWAKGLFESGDGKDEESSSEDMNASFALKLWGLTTGNQNLVDISNIQLGILKSSLNKYFLYSNDNSTEPPQFLPNKVSGILFENKIDHTTYFGNKIEYIQMIHSIPIIPPSSFIRSPTFVKEEWDQILTNIVNDVQDGWRGIIMLNGALFDPQMSYNFFNDPNFNRAYLDNGQSLTWSLAFSGAYK
ncbi:endo-1,3(4)-beta-glucanase [Maudiozyma humilis]|uniref:glucan endo-1,3-beta-D-glucosidase n=1 Tax=Maudiozyma humilis TaxID=51915 RepID=A0AAV5S6T6_MAUHU|nr:endo-1,3(4)-beta-glucanase [Kazachstania humilis]